MSYASNNEIFLAVQLDDYGIKQRANSTETEQEASSNLGSFLSINPNDQVMSVGITLIPAPSVGEVCGTFPYAGW